MAVLHKLEEQFYGPDSPIESKGRVLLYISHCALKDRTNKKRIPKREIIQATGVEKRLVERCLKSLETEKHLLVTRTKNGNVWGDNVYELHPERYALKNNKPISSSKPAEVPLNKPVDIPTNNAVRERERVEAEEAKAHIRKITGAFQSMPKAITFEDKEPLACGQFSFL